MAARAEPVLLALDLREQLIRASVQPGHDPAAAPFPLPREQVVGRVQEGTPLLHDQPIHVDVGFLGTLAELAVAPLRRVYARRLLPMIERLDEGEPSPRWQHGYCPVCGGWPLVAELRGSANVWIWRCGA